MHSIDEITSPALSPRCLTCRLDRYIDAYPKDIPWQEQAEYQRRVLRALADGADHMTAPEISHELGAILAGMFGIERDFTDIKTHFNQLVLGLEERILERMDRSDDPLDLAIRCALIGNFIDFGQTGSVNEAKLLELVEDAANLEIDTDSIAELKDRIREAQTVAYITDNCGEVVFDKILIEEMRKANPGISVTAIVRGAPAANDATMDDALEVGLDAVATVIDNGDILAGTVPSRVNEATRTALKDSDLVIAKGLANFETLSGTGKNIRFMFLVKCDLYEDIFEVPLNTGVIVKGV